MESDRVMGHKWVILKLGQIKIRVCDQCARTAAQVKSQKYLSEYSSEVCPVAPTEWETSD